LNHLKGTKAEININGLLRKKMEKLRYNRTLFLICLCLISALSLAAPCTAQTGYHLENPAVTPDYGYEEFNYTDQVSLINPRPGEIMVTTFSWKLNIYDKDKQIYTESSPGKRGLSQTTFSFGPYSFKDNFGIASTSNASFEFVFYAGGQQVAKTVRIKGPIVQPPTMTGIQFEKKPYFFQGIAVSAGFKDLEGLDPKPTCLLKITGPLGTIENRTWESQGVACPSSGKSGYTCILNEPLSQYRDGGNFSFVLVYNNLKSDAFNFGPYSIALRPYASTAESPKIDKSLDYTNFTILSTVRDASAKMEESNPQGRLIISQPQKGEIAYTSSDPQINGDKVIFKWTNENEQALFNRSDVELSRAAPLSFSARIEYTNDKWDFHAISPNVTFNVVEEVPKLVSQSIPKDVYISSGETSTQEMSAIVAFSKGAGQLDVRISGPSMDYKSTMDGTPIGGNKYQFKWQVQFDDSHVNNNYTVSMSFLNDQVESGRYDFVPPYIHVSPISVQFLEGDVQAPSGQWNDRYNYSVKLDTSVPVSVQLQVYDLCSNDWVNKQTKDAAVGTATVLTWPLRPFSYECDEMAGKAAKYRFKAIFAGEEIASSRPFSGPRFLGARPVLISLTPEGDPMVVYLSEEGATGSVSATVEYGSGQGKAILRLTAPDGRVRMEEPSDGMSVGGDMYRYDWSLPFDADDANKSFNLSIAYKHPTITGEYPLVEKAVRVVPVAIDLSAGQVYPKKERWNSTFDYSVRVSTSVETTVKLEVYDPCRRAWIPRASAKAVPGERVLNMSAVPFKNRCADAEGKEASFYFIASFADKTYESEVYPGPTINGGKPKLVSVDFEPVLHVSEGTPAYQSVKAIVDFPQGQDAIEITTVGPDKIPATEEMKAVYLGATQYLYTWSKEFGKGDVGNQTISLHNVHPKTAGGEIAFTGTMTVVLEKTDSGLEPKAMGDVNYLPVLFVTPEKQASQAFSAEVFSPGGNGTMTLDLTGVDKNKKVDMIVTDLGANRYRYDYAESFDASNVGNNYMFSLDYQLDGKSYSLFDNHIMQVALEGTKPEPIWEPKLILGYDTTLYVTAGGKADQLIHATINYSESGGILKLNLTGPNKNFPQDLSDRVIGVDRYLYEAVVPFEESDIGNSFTISLTFNHSGLAGGDYRFADHYMRVLKKSPISQPGSPGTGDAGQKYGPFNDSSVTVIGNVTPAVGVIQAWDEKDPLHALTYTLKLQNWSSQQVPRIKLSVRPFGSDQPWMIAGGEKIFNPATRSVSWTLKPFWETPILGMAEYKFSIDGDETQTFEGPEIVAVISNAGDKLNSRVHDFWATVNSSENLTVCLNGGDSSIPELIKTWTIKGQCQDYKLGTGEQAFKWQIPESQTSPYYDFDIKRKTEVPIQ